MIEWEIVEPIIGPKTEQETRTDEYLDRMLDYMVDLGRHLDHYEIWIG
jgi:hypothetical protein